MVLLCHDKFSKEAEMWIIDESLKEAVGMEVEFFSNITAVLEMLFIWNADYPRWKSE
jgi:hypothetical protein